MANPDHLAKLHEGVEVWNQWRREHQDIQPDLQEADLAEADLQEADLRGANLREATLREAILGRANLQQAILFQADLQKAHLGRANLREAILGRANLQQTTLFQANLQKAIPFQANLQGADLRGANLQQAILFQANLQQAVLFQAHVQGTDLREANLQGAHLRGASLQKADLSEANLRETDLQEAFFDTGTRLSGVMLGDGRSGCLSVADLNWGGANLAVVDWTAVKMLGDESKAQQVKTPHGKRKTKPERMEDSRRAVRANRQLAVVLRNQGLNEEADYFAYRAQRLQRIVLRSQGQFGRYLFSGLLDLLAGYGYKPIRSVIAYLLLIFGFMGLYLLNAHFVTPHLRWDEALVLSVSSFHGRGFFSQDLSLGETYARLAAAEAVVGLLIEISFIATFTQRFFAR